MYDNLPNKKLFSKTVDMRTHVCYDDFGLSDRNNTFFDIVIMILGRNGCMSKVIVIGAGASGMLAAIYASAHNEVILLEKNDKTCKKILVSGNGKCNYFNSDQNISHYHNYFLKDIIDNNTNEILEFFGKIGIVPKIKNGYYYPYSESAASIKEALMTESRLCGVNIVTDYTVTKIEKKDVFIINNELKADKVILACGSLASKFGTDLGYEIAQSFGHKINNVLPALTGLKSDEKFLKDWNGVRGSAKVSLYINDEFIKEEEGEVQFTDYGVSGICVFNLSYLVSLNKGKNIKLKINFMPFTDNVLEFLEKRCEVVTGRTIIEFLEGIIHYKLIKIILNNAGINGLKYYDELSKKEKYKLCEAISAMKINIIGTNSFDKSQVCTGGIDINEIDMNTMESKLVKDLYITGELLDVDGDCGGYNLSFAFISGMLGGKATND